MNSTTPASHVTDAGDITSDGLKRIVDDWCWDITREFRVGSEMYEIDDECALVELTAHFGNVKRLIIPFGPGFRSDLGAAADHLAEEDRIEAEAYVASYLTTASSSSRDRSFQSAGGIV